MTQTTSAATASLTGKWKPYPAYKVSGVEWLGKIPAHWEITAIKKLAKPDYQAFTDGDWIEAPYITQEGIRLLQTGNVGIGEFKEQGFRYISEETFNTLGCTEVLPGDVLICRLADPVGRACIAPEIGVRMITSVDVCILKLNGNFDSHFVIYFLSSPRYLTWMQALCRGGTRDRVSRSMLGAIEFPVPTYHEQRAIAAFLDRETARINALIAKKERLIELLQEKRAALISHAVTRGLDPMVPMKDSGVEWLGEIPVHWEARQFKRVSEISYGLTLELDRTETEGTYIISLPNVTKEGQLLLNDVPLTPLTSEEKKKLLLRKGDLLFNWRNGSSDHVGKTAYFNADGEYTHVSFLLRIRFDPTKYDSRYYQMFLNNLRNTEFFSSAKNRVNKTYNQTELGRLEVMVPPFEEQRMIATYLGSQTAKIDALISRIREGIEKLKEYSTALISAAVTGKIDVRETIGDHLENP